MFVGMLNPRNGQIDYINAGHNPPFIIDAQGKFKTKLNPTGPAVGMMRGFDFAIERAELEPGDSIIAYTDGVTEARAANKEFYSEKRLLDLLSEPVASATDLVDRVRDSIRSFTVDAIQNDDITMITVRRTH
jgi:serine phosphatase RsbU (regulator of sigma subunit)